MTRQNTQIPTKNDFSTITRTIETKTSHIDIHEEYISSNFAKYTSKIQAITDNLKFSHFPENWVKSSTFPTKIVTFPPTQHTDK